jgi:hypothetical protein
MYRSTSSQVTGPGKARRRARERKRDKRQIETSLLLDMKLDWSILLAAENEPGRTE